ncbi:hypothetical protein EVAR_7944_1 [Eumeta japonica]|uniref:Mos1 transposase HTH domain-containing protein n=1 Tax=Eumeta variegata TaxID=151549 RepID=A0A4C1THV7_EUMVA|nr:hypothetical protein EVAR_7944_1 [Eumeta japonica]
MAYRHFYFGFLSTKMSESNVEIRYILKFYYKNGTNAIQVAKKICDFYRSNAVSVRVAQNWFKRFQSDNFDVIDEPRFGPPVTDKVDEKVEQNRHIEVREKSWELTTEQF